MFDQSKIGQSFPSFTYQVERCKIHELNLAIGDENPIYHSKEAAQAAGYPDVPASPTTPTTFQFWGNPDFVKHLMAIGVNVMRIIHGEEEYEYLAPIYAGDVLTGVTTLVDGKSRQSKDGSSMDILTLETRYTNQKGQEVLKARQVLIVR
ncbi:MAG: MaoC family dehydratase N-terminal domain-containing protein [Thermogemmatispora sp.]|uniref:FAS1-like dehydratase domain-containing protein n=1 Tax=Thermogemmatispora sp. TaxID=1968838 RepID=UPI002639D03B|nr:MaoC family dehydratase N-terminal domain-containing protein [Thermogemmatispora sp.]MBX5455321.1 MaoC family dehydratase N-terminal domain-containing protein [Thermogemmatispora sp.]